MQAYYPLPIRSRPAVAAEIGIDSLAPSDGVNASRCGLIHDTEPAENQTDISTLENSVTPVPEPDSSPD